jgi:glutathione synthase/RimK-type ligase-like ATP-grasp enzyme
MTRVHNYLRKQISPIQPIRKIHRPPANPHIPQQRRTHKTHNEIFDELGKPVVIKAPYTSFSKYVEKAACETSFRDVAKRFFKKSDVLAIQKFTPTEFDCRVGVLNNDVHYVCKYMITKGRWKHGAKLRGKPTFIWGRTAAGKRKYAPAPPKVDLKAAVSWQSLYGVDIKEVDGEFVVVEVKR